MRIGIDLQVLGQREFTGIAHYACNLSQHLLQPASHHQFVFFLPKKSWFAREFQSRGAEVVVLPEKKLPFVTAHWQYARVMQKAKLDILHGPANVLPLFYRGHSILTIHDLAIYRHPEWFPRGQWFSTKYLVPRSIRKAEKIIVPSEATRKDLEELLAVEDEKVWTIPHGVEERYFRSEKRLATGDWEETNRKPARPAGGSQIANRYILFVGTWEPRKNIARLIEAYAALPEDILAKYDLAIAGQRGLGFEEVLSEISNLQFEIRSKVKLLNYVPEGELPILYKRASVFVYPSLYEGFGLPILEAMAAGVPVVTSHQVARNMEYEIWNRASAKVLVLVDPYSIEEIRAAIVRLIRDGAKASEISQEGVSRAREFTWFRTAQRTLEAYLA